MTDDLIRRLIAAGLTKQQASSTTAETLVRLFMPEDGKMLIREAKQQVAEMQATVKALRKEYDDLSAKIKQISDNVLAAIDAQKEFGSITDEKARNAIALYSALLGMNQRAGADGMEAVRNAGYIMYAYLGGQARRDITYTQE
jgi:polyhydroxyalkanoate synthesis regulator phasin